MVEVRFINDTTPIEVTSDEQVTEIQVGGLSHGDLSDRDLSDQHPIGAITGLQDALDTIPTDYISDAELEAALLEKQDTLTAGANIQIVGNTISATDTTYTAGTGISIIGNVISNTQTSAEWGNITGALSAQTDLWNVLEEKANVADIPTATSDLLNDSGFITLSALTPYATQNWVSQQGYLTEIPAEYVTDSELTAKGYQTAADVETAITAKGYTTMSAVEAKGYITNAALVGYATESYVTTAVGTETTNRQNADNNLQSQIDAITASSDVTDIVGTYAELQSYDTSTLPPNSIIKVLQDESRNNETTYYRWVITGGVGAWSLIGEEGPYYTISAADAKFATQTALSTGLAAKQDTISDLSTIRAGASAGSTAVQPSDLATVATSGNYSDLNGTPIIPTATSDLTNDSGFITLSALTGYATESWVGQQGYITGITSTDVTTALGFTPYSATNPAGYITSSALTPYALSANLATVATSGSYNDLLNKPTIPAAQVNSDWNATSGVARILNKPTIPTVPTNVSAFTNDAGYITSSALTGYATQTWVGQQGFITGITSSDVTTALGYTPYNSSNPSGFITSAALAPYVLSANLATVATSGSYTDLSDKPTIPTVNNPTITITQGGTTKGTFTLNQSSNETIALDAGGGGGSYTAGDGIDITNNVISVDGVQTTETTLATVATSGSYNDLSNKPTIPAAQVNSDWNAISGVARILNKPTIPTVPTNVSAFTNDAGYITNSALTGYATQIWVGQQGFITGITSSDVTTALGYTPYNATNPAGYITSSALTPYALSANLATVATSGAYSDLSGKPTVDQTYDGTSANAQSGVAIAGVLGDIETAINTIRGV